MSEVPLCKDSGVTLLRNRPKKVLLQVSGRGVPLMSEVPLSQDSGVTLGWRFLMSEVPLCQDSGVTLIGLFLVSEVHLYQDSGSTLDLCLGPYGGPMGVFVSYVDALVPGLGGDAAAQPPDGRGHRAGLTVSHERGIPVLGGCMSEVPLY